MTAGLHARARRVPLAAVAVVVVTVGALWWGQWLEVQPGYSSAQRWGMVKVVPTLLVMAVGATLAGADGWLERSAARLTPASRARHALVGAVVAVAAAGLVLPHDAWHYGGATTARNAAGLLGIALVSAVLLPARAAWAPVPAYVLVVWMASPSVPTASSRWWAFQVTSGRWDASWAAAALLLVVGLALYASRGPRPAAPDLA